MQALMLKSLGQLELVDKEIPDIREDEILVKTAVATICTSDVNDVRENPFGATLPVVMGHEGAGTVAALGAAVKGFQVGQRIATHPVHPCGQCPPCREGLGHLCLNMGHFGLNLPGTMAEYYLVRHDRARPIPDSVAFSVAALTEPVCVCVEALEQARLSAGSSLLVIGDGPFGALMTRLAQRLPLENLVQAGQMDFRLSFGRGSRQVNTTDSPDPAASLLQANDGQGYEAAILAVGSRKAFVDGLKCLKPRGRMVVFSALTGDTPVDLFHLHLKELEIVGACSDRDQLDAAVSLLGDPSLALGELVTHTFPLSDFRQAFELAEFGKERAMKVAFAF